MTSYETPNVHHHKHKIRVAEGITWGHSIHLTPSRSTSLRCTSRSPIRLLPDVARGHSLGYHSTDTQCRLTEYAMLCVCVLNWLRVQGTVDLYRRCFSGVARLWNLCDQLEEQEEVWHRSEEARSGSANRETQLTIGKQKRVLLCHRSPPLLHFTVRRSSWHIKNG